jgi:hypothetical protein
LADHEGDDDDDNDDDRDMFGNRMHQDIAEREYIAEREIGGGDDNANDNGENNGGDNVANAANPSENNGGDNVANAANPAANDTHAAGSGPRKSMKR